VRGVTITLLLALSSAFALAQLTPYQQAEALLQKTEYQAAIALLKKTGGPTNAPEFLLQGRAYYLMGEFKKAQESFEAATKHDPTSSEAQHWLGRAYGKRAETSNPFQAPGLASNARKSFEKAVALNPNNLEAVNDLFTYYLEAPGFLGGGLDKAMALAEQLKSKDPVEYHYAAAQIAERRKEYNIAEAQLRKAVDLAPRQVGRVIDLAKFLARRGRYSESEEAFKRAEQIKPDSPKVVFERASVYLETKRNLPEARQMLQKYLTMQLSPDDPPRQEAERLLKQLAGAGG